MFAFDPAVLAEPRVYLAALGQAFFSLGVGMAIFITYGRYLRPSYRIAESSAAVAIGDSLIAVLAGIAIFTAVFSFSMDPAAGPELAFITLPQIFLVMPGGKLVAVAFFALLVAAALTSMVSVLEVPVAHLQRKTGWGRRRLAVLVAAAILALGIPSTLGFGVLSGIAWHGRGIMDRSRLPGLEPAAAGGRAPGRDRGRLALAKGGSARDRVRDRRPPRPPLALVPPVHRPRPHRDHHRARAHGDLRGRPAEVAVDWKWAPIRGHSARSTVRLNGSAQVRTIPSDFAGEAWPSRKEKAHRVVSERQEAEPFVEAFRVIVRGIHEHGVHGHGFTGRPGYA